jgi:hypothetical protein
VWVEENIDEDGERKAGSYEVLLFCFQANFKSMVQCFVKRLLSTSIIPIKFSGQVCRSKIVSFYPGVETFAPYWVMLFAGSKNKSSIEYGTIFCCSV